LTEALTNLDAAKAGVDGATKAITSALNIYSQLENDKKDLLASSRSFGTNAQKQFDWAESLKIESEAYIELVWREVRVVTDTVICANCPFKTLPLCLAESPAKTEADCKNQFVLRFDDSKRYATPDACRHANPKLTPEQCAVLLKKGH
jgi:hypothetical protein